MSCVKWDNIQGLPMEDILAGAAKSRVKEFQGVENALVSWI